MTKIRIRSGSGSFCLQHERKSSGHFPSVRLISWRGLLFPLFFLSFILPFPELAHVLGADVAADGVLFFLPCETSLFNAQSVLALSPGPGQRGQALAGFGAHDNLHPLALGLASSSNSYPATPHSAVRYLLRMYLSTQYRVFRMQRTFYGDSDSDCSDRCDC